MHEEGSSVLARVPHLTLSVESNHWAIRCAQAGLGTRGVSELGSGTLRSPPTSLRMLADFETSFTSCGSN